VQKSSPCSLWQPSDAQALRRDHTPQLLRAGCLQTAVSGSKRAAKAATTFCPRDQAPPPSPLFPPAQSCPHATQVARRRRLYTAVQARGAARCGQVHSTAEAVAERPAAVEEAFDFGAYMKQRAVLVNEALERSVPLQYPEVINESMRCGRPRLAPLVAQPATAVPACRPVRPTSLWAFLASWLPTHLVNALEVSLFWESQHVRCSARTQAIAACKQGGAGGPRAGARRRRVRLRERAGRPRPGRWARQVLAAGGRQARAAVPVPGRVRGGGRRGGHSHAGGVRDGDAAHDVAHPRRPAVHGQRRLPARQAHKPQGAPPPARGAACLAGTLCARCCRAEAPSVHIARCLSCEQCEWEHAQAVRHVACAIGEELRAPRACLVRRRLCAAAEAHVWQYHSPVARQPALAEWSLAGAAGVLRAHALTGRGRVRAGVRRGGRYPRGRRAAGSGV